ncbi:MULTISPECIES: class IIb bacteriocin, lactobin A/cerein 7B family [unclassified Shewanella]|nr:MULTISPECIES: class IIb bacteriocin, lactobin A/cerein 7B family [unclassified Shewanella]GIU14583.1 hypothetical protein TUM4444_24570 [Shewanella sp. MBTL60-112-B1]GIU29373.1 hypothetical protein TUM4445_11510 [Shewanella sp. MBTL60-112-B2]
MKELSKAEIKLVKGGGLPFIVAAGIHLAGQAAAIYGTYRLAKKLS